MKAENGDYPNVLVAVPLRVGTTLYNSSSSLDATFTTYLMCRPVDARGDAGDNLAVPLASISWRVKLYVTWDARDKLPTIVKKDSYVSVMGILSPFKGGTSWKFDAATGYPTWTGVVDPETFSKQIDTH